MHEPRDEQEKLLFEWAEKRLALERLRREGRETSLALNFLTSETHERFVKWLEVAA